MAFISFFPESTKDGYLPPWQIAMAYAYHEVADLVAEYFENHIEYYRVAFFLLISEEEWLSFSKSLLF